MHKKMILGRTW